MNHKKKIYRLLFVATTLTFIGFVLAMPEKFGLCEKNDTKCIHGYINNFDMIVTVLVIFSIPVFIISCSLLFVKEQVFNKWFKFAIIYVPISIVLIAIASPTGDMFFPSLRETLTFLLPIVFFIASLFIIIFEHIKLRRK